MEETYYQLLGVNEDADVETIKKAYCLKVKIFHPHKHKIEDDEVQGECERVMKEINTAYTTLIDDNKRKAYDDTLRENRENSERLNNRLNSVLEELTSTKEKARSALDAYSKEKEKSNDLENLLKRAQNELSKSDAKSAKKKLQKLAIASILSIIIIIGIIITAISVRGEKDAYFAERPVYVQDTVNIEGIYCLRKTIGEKVDITTAEIKAEENGYTMTIFSDYLPCSTPCYIKSDGIFHTDMWGDGKILFSPSDGSIKIKYELSDNTLCELSRQH